MKDNDNTSIGRYQRNSAIIIEYSIAIVSLGIFESFYTSFAVNNNISWHIHCTCVGVFYLISGVLRLFYSWLTIRFGTGCNLRLILIVTGAAAALSASAFLITAFSPEKTLSEVCSITFESLNSISDNCDPEFEYRCVIIGKIQLDIGNQELASIDSGFYFNYYNKLMILQNSTNSEQCRTIDPKRLETPPGSKNDSIAKCIRNVPPKPLFVLVYLMSMSAYFASSSLGGNILTRFVENKKFMNQSAVGRDKKPGSTEATSRCDCACNFSTSKFWKLVVSAYLIIAEYSYAIQTVVCAILLSKALQNRGKFEKFNYAILFTITLPNLAIFCLELLAYFRIDRLRKRSRDYGKSTSITDRASLMKFILDSDTDGEDEKFYEEAKYSVDPDCPEKNVTFEINSGLPSQKRDSKIRQILNVLRGELCFIMLIGFLLGIIQAILDNHGKFKLSRFGIETLNTSLSTAVEVIPAALWLWFGKDLMIHYNYQFVEAFIATNLIMRLIDYGLIKKYSPWLNFVVDFSSGLDKLLYDVLVIRQIDIILEKKLGIHQNPPESKENITEKINQNPSESKENITEGINQNPLESKENITTGINQNPPESKDNITEGINQNPPESKDNITERINQNPLELKANSDRFMNQDNKELNEERIKENNLSPIRQSNNLNQTEAQLSLQNDPKILSVEVLRLISLNILYSLSLSVSKGLLMLIVSNINLKTEIQDIIFFYTIPLVILTIIISVNVFNFKNKPMRKAL